jgi:DNA-binding GntR family transcriptional regulator
MTAVGGNKANVVDKARPNRGQGAKHVYDALYREILTLALEPGALLDETTLARRFGMSRSPIREALIRLSGQGLVVMLANRSTLVAPLDLIPFPKYVEALDLLQRVTTRLAAELRSESDVVAIAKAAKVFETAVKKDDHLEMSATNRDFHLEIAKAGKNPYLTRQYGALLDEGRRILHIHFGYLAKAEGERLLTDDHQEMVDAVAEQDVERAEALAHAHTRQFRDRFFRFMRLNFAEKMALSPSHGGGPTSGFGLEQDEPGS